MFKEWFDMMTLVGLAMGFGGLLGWALNDLITQYQEQKRFQNQWHPLNRRRS